MFGIYRMILVGMAAVTLAACGSSKVSSFYTLDTDPGLTRTENATPVYIVVAPVTVPDLVDRPQIVTSGAGGQVQLQEFDRWAQPLKSDIARVIAANLGELLGTEQATVFDVGGKTAPAWRVRVDVMRFDTTLGDSVTIDAIWAVRPPGEVPALLGRSVAHEAVRGTDYAEIVAAHDRALGTVSREIASAIRTNLPK